MLRPGLQKPSFRACQHKAGEAMNLSSVVRLLLRQRAGFQEHSQAYFTWRSSSSTHSDNNFNWLRAFQFLFAGPWSNDFHVQCCFIFCRQPQTSRAIHHLPSVRRSHCQFYFLIRRMSNDERDSQRRSRLHCDLRHLRFGQFPVPPAEFLVIRPWSRQFRVRDRCIFGAGYSGWLILLRTRLRKHIGGPFRRHCGFPKNQSHWLRPPSSLRIAHHLIKIFITHLREPLNVLRKLRQVRHSRIHRQPPIRFFL